MVHFDIARLSESPDDTIYCMSAAGIRPAMPDE
jgi:hypothetical protein